MSRGKRVALSEMTRMGLFKFYIDLVQKSIILRYIKDKFMVHELFVAVWIEDQGFTTY